MNNVIISLISAVGMIAVAGVSVVYWRRVSGLQYRWFWVGAALWTVAVALKVVCALLTNALVIGFLKENLSPWLFVLCGGLFIGFQSAIFEVGLTILAGLIWRQLGSDANRAIGIGVGAGAFEALLLGIASFAMIILCLAGLPGAENTRDGIDKVAAVTRFFWLVPPVERILAILCHASSRALVLLGTTYRKPMLVFWGFLLFMLTDSIAGMFYISGKVGQVSLWWIELAVLPIALASIPILRWCYVRWKEPVCSPGDTCTLSA